MESISQPEVVRGLSTAVPPIFNDGDDAQKLIECNRKLQELGINDTIKLPRIVVIGDQSTGKSSLIEAISGVTVPTASGLCTRCPININLVNTPNAENAWSAKVSIEEHYTYDVTFIATSRRKTVTRNNPLGPWQPQPQPHMSEVKTVTTPADLLDTIKIAEQRVLSAPSQNAFDSNAGDMVEVFSPNAIRLDIQQRNCPNLSFVDLPGVIANVKADKPRYLVDLVRSLAKQYALDENNILIMTLPMNHDTDNITSLGLVKDQNALGRTMAVFTKPDTVDLSEQERYLNEYFLGEVHEDFAFGQHMVMLKPHEGDKASAETAFFGQPPFSSLDVEMRKHLGVQNLTGTLRQILFTKTANSLPENLQKIEARLQEVTQNLNRIPAPLDKVEQPYLLRERVGHLEETIKKLFSSTDGRSGQPSLRSQILNLMQMFAKRIKDDHKPKLIVLTSKERTAKLIAEKALQEGTTIEPYVVDDDENDDFSNNHVKHETISQRQGQPPGDLVVRFMLEEIRDMNVRAFKGTVPGSVESEAVQQMQCMALEPWSAIVKDFFQGLEQNMQTTLCATVERQFQAERHLPLFNRVRELTARFVSVAFADIGKAVTEVCAAEMAQPFTLSLQRFHSAEERYLNEFRAIRDEKRLEIRTVEHKATASSKKKKVKEPATDTLEPDPWQIEVIMMSKTRAYYEIAADRFVDTICQLINARLIPNCQAQLVPFIREQLGLDNIHANGEDIVELMTEDIGRERLRRRLHEEQIRLNEGHAFIAQALGASSRRQLSLRPVTRGSDVTMVDDPFVTTGPGLGTPSAKRGSASDAVLAEREDIDESPTKRGRMSH